MEQQLLDSAWRDLDEAESSKRAVLETRHEQVLGILIELAYELRGEAMEYARSLDPQAPFHWTHLEWRDFWFGGNRLLHPDMEATWAKDIQAAPGFNEPENLQLPKYNALDVYRALHAISLLEGQMGCHLHTIQILKEEVQKKELEISALSQATPQEKAEKGVGAIVPKADSRNRVSEEMFQEQMKQWGHLPVPERIPRKWQSRFTFGENPTRMERVFQILFAFRAGKLSCRTEIDWMVSALSGTAIGNKTSKRCFYDLKKAGMVEAHQFWFKELGFKTELTFCRLTQDGKELCQELGLPDLGPSEFEKAIANGADIESARDQLVFAFAFHAHLRKWKCRLFPSDNLGDLIVSKKDETCSVIVVPEKTPNEEIQERIGNIPKEKGNIGIVTITPERGKNLAEWCREQQLDCIRTNMKMLINKELDGEKIIPFFPIEPLEEVPLWRDTTLTLNQRVIGSSPIWVIESAM